MKAPLFKITMENGDVIENEILFILSDKADENNRNMWRVTIREWSRRLDNVFRPTWFSKFKYIEVQEKPQFKFLRDEIIDLF